jgi:voltage-gated potassium channel
MLIGFTGIGTTTYLFSTITAFILETNVNPAYRRRRMECTITAMSGHYIVCGIGRVGSYIADELIKTERPFVAIDVNEQISRGALQAHRESHFPAGRRFGRRYVAKCRCGALPRRICGIR